MPHEEQPITKKDFTDLLDAALKKQSEDIVHTLTKRSEAVEDMLDALIIEVRTGFGELKTLAKQTIADEAANTVEIGRLKEDLAQVNKHVGMKL